MGLWYTLPLSPPGSLLDMLFQLTAQSGSRATIISTDRAGSLGLGKGMLIRKWAPPGGSGACVKLTLTSMLTYYNNKEAQGSKAGDQVGLVVLIIC
jgi:hypothetical protein